MLPVIRALGYAVPAHPFEACMPAACPDRLPKWVWWLPLPMFHLATWISLTPLLDDGVALCCQPCTSMP